MEVARASAVAAAVTVVLVVALAPVTAGDAGATTATGATLDDGVDTEADRVTVPPRLGAGAAATQAGTPGADVTQVETDRIRLVVAVAADGDATWTVEYRTNLDDQNTTTAFDSLAADIEENPENFTSRFADRIRQTVAAAENTTGREMTAQNFSVEAETDSLNGQGVVRYTYEWSNFAAEDGDRLVVGDAIGGFFLDSRTSLRVEWAEGLGVAEVRPEPDASAGRSLTWRGTDTEFGPDQPRVVLAPGAGGPNGDGGDPQEDGGGLPLAVVGVVLAVVAVAVALVARRGIGVGPDGGESRSDAGADDDGGATVTGAADDATTGTRAADAEDGDEEVPVDEELLSNEERVLRLLEERGGRIKQQEVVEALDWTEAKTSQVVSGMRDEGTIEGFRLGRENVLTLPDADIAEEPDDGAGDGDAPDRQDWGGDES